MSSDDIDIDDFDNTDHDLEKFESTDDNLDKFEKIFAKKRKVLDDGFDRNKVENQVLDKSTMFTLYDMINAKVISYVNGIVKAGKESVLFWAVDPHGKDVALKVYLVSTVSFKKRAAYIVGDPRFTRLKSGTRNMVYLWAKKEYRNLRQCARHNIPVPKAIYVSNNVLAMEFVGKDGIPSPTLHETEITESDYTQVIDIMTKLYKDARLVHGDFSEYNVLKTDSGLVLFDLGSAVDLAHPNAQNFLERDIKNMTYFFAKRGLTVRNPKDILAEIIS
ncbi:MAG: serine protein kinase RIO [Candidatus Nitrosotenuis sp.]|nr:MAG: serine protein kinase RIO [Candidatus Nitrosotenuis sp.]